VVRRGEQLYSYSPTKYVTVGFSEERKFNNIFAQRLVSLTMHSYIQMLIEWLGLITVQTSGFCA